MARGKVKKVADTSQIKYFNRYSGAEETEKVAGDFMVRFAYDSFLGQKLNPLLTNKYLSIAYGMLQDNLLTQLKVPQFVKKFNINMSEFRPGSLKDNLPKEMSYKSFNEFFIRKFIDGKRNWVNDEKSLPAFAEGRYFGVESINDDQRFPVKGKYLS